MEIRALDANFIPVGLTALRYFDLTWDRKYYEVGMFSMQIRVQDYTSDMQYIYTPERPEIGMIQKVEYSDEDQMVLLRGYFYEGKLADKIVYPTFAKYGTRAAFVAAAVEKYKSDIPKIQIAEYDAAGEKIQKQETGVTLEEMAHSTLQVENKTYRCRYDFEQDVILFEIYAGVDRTQSQTQNNFVTFSKGFRNIKNVRVQEDCSDYKNYFLIAGSGDGDERICEVLDLSGGGYKRELFIDYKGEIYDEKKQTIEEYRAILRQKGIEKAQNYVNIHNIEFDAEVNRGAKYLEDYDLGDKCDILVEPIQRAYEARIIEVLETWSNGEHRTTLTFGDKVPTIYDKVRVK